MDQNERSTRALDYAQESVKQILGLSTGVLALTLTFFEDFAGAHSGAARSCIVISWIFFLIAIISGLLTLLAMTSDLWPKKQNKRTKTVDIWTTDLRIYAIIQVVAFGLGSILMLVAGWFALSVPR